jgi:hypothetical protein
MSNVSQALLLVLLLSGCGVVAFLSLRHLFRTYLAHDAASRAAVVRHPAVRPARVGSALADEPTTPPQGNRPHRA